MNKTGFTLIELLVVIVIIGVLAAIFIPIVKGARETAWRAQCASNLRQHGVAWHLYLDDHNELFPKYDYNGSDIACDTETFGGEQTATLPTPTEVRPLNRYLDIRSDTDHGALEVFHCPSDRRSNAWSGNNFDTRGNSYRANQDILIYPIGTPPEYSQRPLSSITAPYSELELEYEPIMVSGTTWYTYHGGVHQGADGPLFMKRNVLFLDGHVKLWKYVIPSP